MKENKFSIIIIFFRQNNELNWATGQHIRIKIRLEIELGLIVHFIDQSFLFRTKKKKNKFVLFVHLFSFDHDLLNECIALIDWTNVLFLSTERVYSLHLIKDYIVYYEDVARSHGFIINPLYYICWFLCKNKKIYYCKIKNYMFWSTLLFGKI